MISRKTMLPAVLSLIVALLGLWGCSSGGDTSGGEGVATGTTSASPHSAPWWPSPGTATLPTSATDQLQAALDAWVEQGHLIGLTAAVVTADGVWSGAAGVDDAGTTLQPDSSLSIMSISKTFTAAEVMLLSARGLVDLDTPITGYVDVPFETGGATVRQVLAMRSGFPDYGPEVYRTTIPADLDREWTVAEALGTLPDDPVGVGTRGGAPRYNSVNYQLLAELVAEVTGRSFAQAVRADLLDPAGLERTWVQSAEKPLAPLARGRSPASSDIVAETGAYLPSRSFASFFVGSGSMAGDAADTARWGYLLYGGHVVDSTLVTQMEADPQPEPTLGLYALGTMVATDEQGVTMVGHAGGGLDLPYTSILQVFTGSSPVAVALLTPQPADHGRDIYEVFMQLHDIVAD